MTTKTLCIALSLTFAFCLQAQEFGTIQGHVLDAEKQLPLENANVQISGTAIGTATDSSGFFQLKLAPGRYSVQVSRIGFDIKTIEDLLVRPERTTTVSFLLELTPIRMSAVEVREERLWEKALTRASVLGVEKMSSEEVITVPGALDDPTRAVQIFSGAGGSGDYQGYLAVRGGSPNQSQVLVDGIVVPNPYRFRLSIGGGFSTIDPNAMRDMHLHLGGFSAEYGNALSSILEVESRDGDRERFHLQGAVNATDMSGLAEGPLPGKTGSILLTIRRTYYDLIVNEFARTENAAYPFFKEFAGKITLNPSGNDRIDLSVSRMSEGADLSNELSDEGGLTEKVDSYLARFHWRNIALAKLQFDTRIGFYNDQTKYRAAKVDSIEVLTPDGIEYETREEIIESFDSKEKNWIISETVQLQTSEESWLTAGLSASSIPAEMEFDAITPEDEGFVFGRLEAPANVSFDDSYRQYASFVELSTKTTERLHLRLGTRYDYSTLINRGYLSPRLGISYQLNDKTAVEGAWGIFYQYPNPLSIYTRSIPVDLSKNLDVLSAEKATHHLLSFSRAVGAGHLAKLQLYDKEIDRLVLPRDEDSYLPENSGQGRAYGFELIVEREARSDSRLSGLLTYSFGRAKYRRFDSDEWFRFKYDRRHSLTLLTNLRLSGRWSTSLLGQMSSGLPYTDVIGLQSRINSNNSVTVSRFLREKRNESSLPMYARVDIRINYRSSLAGGLSFYVDFINITNRKNIYEISWEKKWLTTGYQKITRREIYSLPRIVTLGLRFRI